MTKLKLNQSERCSNWLIDVEMLKKQINVNLVKRFDHTHWQYRNKQQQMSKELFAINQAMPNYQSLKHANVVSSKSRANSCSNRKEYPFPDEISSLQNIQIKSKEIEI